MGNLKLSMEVWANMPWGRLEICGCAVNSWGKIPLMVPETGVEPARDCSHGILSPGRLPIPPLRHKGRGADLV